MSDGSTKGANRYRQILESVTEFAVIVTDRDGVVTEWNSGAERTLGWTADEMVGQSAERIFTPEDRRVGQAHKEMMAALAEGRGVDERWHLKSDGSRFWASGEMMPLRGDDDENLGFVKILRDRTQQKLAETALEASETRYRTLYDAIDEGFCILQLRFDEHGEPEDYRFLEVNPAFVRQTGLVGVVGRWMRDLSPAHEAHWFEIYGRIARSGKAERFEQYAGSLGNRWFEVHAYPVGQPEAHQVAVLFNDISQRRRATGDLEASETKWRGLFETLQEGFVLGRVVRDVDGCIVDWRYEEVNRAWGDLVGIDPAAVAGQTLREVIPGIEDVWIHEFADVVETGETIRFTRQVGALDRWYDGVCQPLGDDRFTILFVEVTERVRADRRREALTAISEALAELRDPDEMSSAAASIIGRALQVGRVGYGSVAEDGETFTVPSDWTKAGFPSLAGAYRMSDYGLYADDLRQGRTVVIPDIRLDPRMAGNTGPLEKVAVRTLVNHPVVENGRTVAVLYVNDNEPRDWSEDDVAFLLDAANRTRGAIERRRAEIALRESDRRRRLALAVGETGIWELDLATGKVTLDERMRELNGVFHGDLDTEGALGAVHPDDRARLDADLERLASGELETLSIQYRTIGLQDGKLRSIQLYGAAFRRPDGLRPLLIGAGRDVSDRVAAEEAQRVLNHELAHRMKNSLAMVQAITTQTLRQANSMEEGRDAISSRLAALARAQDILTSANFEEADIRDVVAAAAAPHQTANRRIGWSGPRHLLTAQQALGMALAIHELATNAAKYGALSSEGGRIDMTWDRVGGTFAFEWIETGGPAVVAPTRRGFGSKLIERIVGAYFDGTGRIDFDPAGIRFMLTGASSGSSANA